MNVLGIGAHYDDLELGCSGTLIKHVLAGDKVTLLVVSNSNYKNTNGDEVRSANVAHREGLRAAEIIGAELISLSYETLRIPFDEELTRKINRYVEDLAIDTMYSHWNHDLHRDHQNTGQSALMAGRHVPRFLMYRSNYYDTERQFRGNFYSDISDVIEVKKKVIMAHESELRRVRYRWLDFFLHQHQNDGMKIGVEYAECFEIVRYLS
jgi:LmbE family N-acetylglucosaminyl deacetylase